MIETKKITIETVCDNDDGEITETLIIEMPSNITALNFIPVLKRILSFLDYDLEILQKVLKGFNVDIKNLKE